MTLFSRNPLSSTLSVFLEKSSLLLTLETFCNRFTLGGEHVLVDRKYIASTNTYGSRLNYD
jgi:hypothetical protein